MQTQSSVTGSDSTSQNTANTSQNTQVTRDLITASWASVGQLIKVTVDGRTITGRIFCYDYASKTLVLKTLIDEDNYGDTVLINAKSIQEVTKLEQAPLSKEEIKREFSCGEISKVEQDKVLMFLDTQLEQRKQLLEKKKLAQV